MISKTNGMDLLSLALMLRNGSSVGNSASVIVDNALNTDSANPVQNKVVAGTIMDIESDINMLKQNIIDVDSSLMTSSENPVQNKIVASAIMDLNIEKQNNTIINTISDTSVIIIAANNNEYRCTATLTNLTLSYPADLKIDSDYASMIMFKTGSTAPSINYDQPLVLSGTNVTTETVNNKTVHVFEPQENYIYMIGLIWDGSNMNAIVRGAAI